MSQRKKEINIKGGNISNSELYNGYINIINTQEQMIQFIKENIKEIDPNYNLVSNNS